MYVCLCKGITEEMLESVASKGLQGKQALKALGVGSDCGVCLLDALNKFAQKENTNKSLPQTPSLSKQVK